MPDGTPDLTLTFAVTYPEETMTLDAVRRADERLRELGWFETTYGGRRGFARLHEICEYMGDLGPAEWARGIVGLPETCELGRIAPGAMRLLEAAAVEEWWSGLSSDLIELGVELDDWPDVLDLAHSSHISTEDSDG